MNEILLELDKLRKEFQEVKIMLDNNREYMTIEQWANYIGVGRTTAFSLIKRRDIEKCCLRIGKRTMIVRKIWDEIAKQHAELKTAI